jgi:hypothetical protein
VLQVTDSEEEMVAVNLGDDYDKGPFFTTDWGPKDYLVPRSQLERWEAAEAAYESMQSEIERVMDEQRERVRALRAERPKSQFASLLERIYEPTIRAALEQQAHLNTMLGKDGPE